MGKNLEFLNACISNFIIRKRKEDALKLPEKIYHKLYFDMGFFKEEYDNAIEEMIRKMEEKGSSNMELNIAQLGVITSKSKVNSIITLAESLSNKMHKVITTEVAMKENNIVEKKEVELEVANKVIIFCPYTEAINKFVEYFGARCVRIDGSTAQTSALINTIEKLKNLNINVIFFQAMSSCETMYASSILPWSRYLTGNYGQNPGYDPLAVAVQAAHERGIEIHAWLNPLRLGSSTITYPAGHPTLS